MQKKIIAVLLTIACLFTMCTGAFAAEYRELSQGSRDSGDSWSVYSLQMRLKELGLMEGTADGIYGKGTTNAVMAFQEANGLAVTGVADVATQEKLFTYAAEPEAGEETEGSEEAIGLDGAMAMSDVDISIVQGYLFAWGFSDSKPDGKFGKKSEEALRKFMNYSLDDMIAYDAAVRASATPAPTPEPTPSPAPGEMGDIVDVMITPKPTIEANGVLTSAWFDYMQNAFDCHVAELRQGDSGNDVLRMQIRLYGLKYLPGGVDGSFGEHSTVALKYFQRMNGLEETGVLDRGTQNVLFSTEAKTSDKYVTKYKAMVSVKDQRVYIYEWTGSDYTKKVQTFKCSTGTTQNPTVLGTFQASGRNGEWYYMEDSYVWVRYAFVITGGYYFHSVLYKEKGDSRPTESSVRNLGKRASHGCIRLSVDDAKWIYTNCSNGMTVVIYDD